MFEDFGWSLNVISWIDNLAKQSNDRTDERQACHLLAKPRWLDAPADDTSKAHVPGLMTDAFAHSFLLRTFFRG